MIMIMLQGYLIVELTTLFWRFVREFQKQKPMAQVRRSFGTLPRLQQLTV